MRSSAIRVADRIERVHTGVRMEKRIVKVLKAVTEFYDLSLGELLENLVLSTGLASLPAADEDGPGPA
jgi:hypothetical protein